MSKTQLQLELEKGEILHPAYTKNLEYLGRRICGALEGLAPRIEWVVGPSRVGKTKLIEALTDAYKEVRVGGKRRIPLLPIELPPGVSPQSLPSTVLAALGLPARGSALDMARTMKRQLIDAGTKVLLVDEASRFVEPGARVVPRAAGELFNSLVDDKELEMTVVLFGLPRLERLIASSPQFRLRASARREFLPYDARVPADLMAFASCVKTYCVTFEKYGWLFEDPLETLVPQCYLFSGGLVGQVWFFMYELADQIRYQAPRLLTWDDCQAAVAGIETAGHPDFPAFQTRKPVTAVELNAAHAHVFEINEMNLPAMPSAFAQ